MPERLGALSYLTMFLVPSALIALAGAGGSSTADRFGSHQLWVTVVVIAVTPCVVGAALILVRAHVTGVAELSWIGLYFLAVSAMGLAAGLTTPGAIYGHNAAHGSAVLLAVPLGVFFAAPTWLNRFGPWVRAWRAWSVLGIVTITVLVWAMLWKPDLISLPSTKTFAGRALLIVGVVGSAALGWRHVVLARIAQRKAPLWIAASFGLVAAASCAQLWGQSRTLVGWFGLTLEASGVLLGTIVALIVYRRSSSINAVLEPIIAIEPIAALEVGLEPAVAEFVADLDAKDPLTRDHVVRTAELAIQVAQLMRLSPEQCRRAGLVGALHDIGKLRVPDAILAKSGALNDLEWDIMRSHAAHGGEIVAGSEPLAGLADAVRAHHERIDGAGYPDGLAGEEIPLIARIVSVCDAFDAMAYTRRYRSAMDLNRVIEILRKNAGTQWDPLVVQAVINLVIHRPLREPQLLATHRVESCDCLPRDLLGELEGSDKSPPQLANAGAFTQFQKS